MIDLSKCPTDFESIYDSFSLTWSFDSWSNVLLSFNPHVKINMMYSYPLPLLLFKQPQQQSISVSNLFFLSYEALCLEIYVHPVKNLAIKLCAFVPVEHMRILFFAYLFLRFAYFFYCNLIFFKSNENCIFFTWMIFNPNV